MPMFNSVGDGSVRRLIHAFAFELIACGCPLLKPAGVTAYVLVSMILQDPEGHPTRGAGRTGVVEDYLIFGVERLERFPNRADAHRAGDVYGAILPLAQGHDDFESIPPVEFLFQFLGIDEIHIVHSANSFQVKTLRTVASPLCPIPCG